MWEAAQPSHNPRENGCENRANKKGMKHHETGLVTLQPGGRHTTAEGDLPLDPHVT